MINGLRSPKSSKVFVIFVAKSDKVSIQHQGSIDFNNWLVPASSCVAPLSNCHYQQFIVAGLLAISSFGDLSDGGAI